MARKFTKVGIGGTFDHFHQGHKQFIQFAAKLGTELIIGITSQNLTRRKPYAHSVQPFYARKNSVSKYCQDNNISATIVELTDIYGPTLDKESKISKLCVTEDTIAGAQEINKLRLTMNMRPLPTFICPLANAKDGKPINSTRIRAGEINRDGTVYSNILEDTIKLDPDQRKYFSQLHGGLTSEAIEEGELIIVVGDTSIQQFIDENWEFDLGIYDKIEQRQPTNKSFYRNMKPNISVDNIAGTISKELSHAIQVALHNDWQFIQVNGEEDLAVVAATLLTPLDAKIFYGMPNQGLAKLTVSEKIKHDFYKKLLKNS